MAWKGSGAQFSLAPPRKHQANGAYSVQLVGNCGGGASSRRRQRTGAGAVRNVLDNARRPAVGQVLIALTETGDHAVLTVDDDGPGIPPQHREEVFGRFVRLEDVCTPGSGRSGLGLAIARDIVDRHGGTIAASESVTGGGLLIVTLPRAE